MNKHLFSFCIIVQFCIGSIEAQVLSDTVYKETIKSVILQKNDIDLSIPILPINQGEKLQLRFDVLSDAVTENYNYSFQHCNDDWSPSGLAVNEFYSGFNKGSLNNILYSINTAQAYVHYELIFPENETQFKVSGNYVITIYPENNPENPIIQKQFRVFESSTNINTFIKPATEDPKQEQELEIKVQVTNPDLSITQPKQDLKVLVIQNGRKDKMRYIPLYDTRGNTYNFMWSKEAIFDGGNEFRSVDTRNLRNRIKNIDKIQFIGGENHTWLLPEKDRSKDQYIREGDINGKMKIHTDFVDNPNIEGDYTWVHFSLPMRDVRLDGRFYLMGELSNWKIKKESELVWNGKEKTYQNTLYLKQGYYNYQIVLVPFREMSGKESILEGNHVETENDYHIFIYCRTFGDIYDRLIGYQCINSVSK